MGQGHMRSIIRLTDVCGNYPLAIADAGGSEILSF